MRTDMRARLVGMIRTVSRAVPDNLTAKILPRALRWNDAEMRVLLAPNAGVRLLIAPTNSAGQAYRWAQAATKFLPDVGAVNFMTTNARSKLFAFPADLAVPETGYLFAHGWQRRQRKAIIDGFSHVLVESGRYLYGPVPWKSPHAVIDDLRRRGIQVAFLWHGSDIRVPSAHASWDVDSPFGVNGKHPETATATLERNARERLKMIAESDSLSFVSTPGLLHVPRSQWLPVVIDPQQWRSDSPALQSSCPVVAYVPSSSTMKGDDSIDQQLTDLESEGLIEYRRLQNVPSEEMPDVYRSADIVLDQFRLGDYGVAACEAMAAGRLVIGHVHDEVRQLVREMTGRELPIMETRFADISDTIRRVLQDPEPAKVLAEQGVSFVDAVHDGRLSASRMSHFLGIAAESTAARSDA